MGIFMFIVFMIGGILFLNVCLKRSIYHRKEIFQIQKFQEGVPLQLEVVNTGSSYGYFDLDWSACTRKGFNFALVPQSLSYDFKILQQYQAHLKEGCKVFIVLPNLVFAFLDTQTEMKSEKYYYFLERRKIPHYSCLKKFLWVEFPILKIKYVLRWLYRVVNGKPRETVFDLYKKDAVYDLKHVQKAAQDRLEGWKQEFSLQDFASAASAIHLEDRFRETTNLLEEMIGFCLDKRWEPILLVPPVSGVLNSMISKEFMEFVLYRNIERANKEKVRVLDYLYDSRFQEHHLYCNADFMNKAGRRAFTRTLWKECGGDDTAFAVEGGGGR